ncbi:hypothetical protein SDD30_15335 [Moorella naiadis]|uniref:hypothetical protein n=1 Tax=Moorella naiadis (nom. illeg.) TaxID=3093670 RepID=UPI003D9C96E4
MLKTGHKIIDQWLNLPWPEESMEDYQKFGKASALLYSFLNREVMTPRGKGVLLQVLGKKCYVAFYGNETENSETKRTKGGDRGRFADGGYFYCWEVRPSFDAAAAVERGA